MITYLINKLMEWQWVLLWAPPMQMHFYNIMKEKGWTIVLPTLNLQYTEGILIISLSFFLSEEHPQPFVDYMSKQHRCLKFTPEAENDPSFSILNTKITCHNSNLKHPFIINQLSLVYLRNIKVIWIKNIGSH